MRLLTKFKGWLPQYKANILLAAPVVLSQVGQVVVQLVDNAMVGPLGAVPLAAVSFGGAIFTIFMMWGMGLSLGLTPLVGAMYSKKSYRPISYLFQNSIVLYTGVGIALFFILYFLGAFMGHMGQEEEVVAIATPYYHFLAWSIVPYMIYVAFKQFLEGVGNTMTGMVVVMVSNCINVFFNYLLIYGEFGFPEMGAAGAGLATLISRICMPVFMIIYFARNHSMRRYIRLFERSKQSWLWTKQLLQVGLPISAQVLMEFLAFGLTLIMMGWINSVSLAAHQIVVSCVNFTFMIVVGISTATTILVSHEFGVGNLRGLNRATNASYHLGIAANLITMACFILFRYKIPLLFTTDPEVIEIAAQLFIMAGLFQVFDGLQVISLGVLRGLQDVRKAMVYAFLAYIVINLPVGYLLAFVLNMGPIGLWIGFIFGLGCAALMFYIRYRKLYKRMLYARSMR